MTSDILTGRELDKAVAKMMGWTFDDETKRFYGRGLLASGFQTPNAFYNIVLPWVREQGWEMETNITRDMVQVQLWPDRERDYQKWIEAHHPDFITTVLNALVCASEGQS